MFIEERGWHNGVMQSLPNEKKVMQEGKNSTLIEKIQQLGSTNVPQMSQDSKIHCLTIIGQIEGHMQLLLKIKQRNMNMLFHKLWQLNKIQILKDYLLF